MSDHGFSSDILERLRYEECDLECERPCHIMQSVHEDAIAEIQHLRSGVAAAVDQLEFWRQFADDFTKEKFGIEAAISKLKDCIR
jgi:hypothetical protein